MEVPIYIRKAARGMTEQVSCDCLFYPPFLLIAVIWTIFLLVGTLFYTYHENYGWALGTYYAVNVGFNIGWNWEIEESDDSKIFSLFYLVTGFFLLALLVVFISEVSLNRERRYKHFVRYIEYLEYEEEVKAGLAEPESFGDTCNRWAIQNYVTLALCAILFLWVVVGVIWSCLVLEWSVLDGLYFSLSSLSAGGMYSLPDDTPEYVYGVTAVYAAVGIPVMILTFGFIAASLVLPLTYYEQFLTLHDKVSSEEISGMFRLMERGGLDYVHSPTLPRRQRRNKEAEALLKKSDRSGLAGKEEDTQDWRDSQRAGAGDATIESSRLSSDSLASQQSGFSAPGTQSGTAGKDLDATSYVLLMTLRMKLIDNAFASYLLKVRTCYPLPPLTPTPLEGDFVIIPAALRAVHKAFPVAYSDAPPPPPNAHTRHNHRNTGNT